MITNYAFGLFDGSLRQSYLRGAGLICSGFGLQNTPHLVRDLKSGPESGPVAMLCRHQTNFYIIITNT